MSTAMLPDIVTQLGDLGDSRMEVKLAPCEVGCLQRRNVRLLIAMAEMDGVNVDCHEDRGLLASVFLVKMTGPARLLRRHLTRLLILSEDE